MKRIIAITTLMIALATSAFGADVNLDDLPPLPTSTFNDGGITVDANGHLIQWLMMIPPITDGYEVLSSTPISEWQQADTYISRTTCNNALPTFGGNYMIQLILRQGGSIGMDQLGAVMNQTQHATCIASNDRRLR
jgi:hypothetical protein